MGKTDFSDEFKRNPVVQITERGWRQRSRACRHSREPAKRPQLQWVTLGDLPEGQLGRTFCEALWQPSLMRSTVTADEVVEPWKSFAWEDVIFYFAGAIADLRWRRRCRSVN